MKVSPDAAAPQRVSEPSAHAAAAQPPSATAATAPKVQETPLLLADEEPPSAEAGAAMADNSRCQVCHLNLAQEELALTHARARVGCADCHGASDAHIADESWASGGSGTAPDKMYLPAQITPFCLGCHPQDRLKTEVHKEFISEKSNEKYCTDCHGKHRLPVRKCKWKT